MEVLRTIALYVDGKDMPFAVIGGHAVNALCTRYADLALYERIKPELPEP